MCLYQSNYGPSERGVSLAASKSCVLSPFLIKADWAFGKEGAAKHFLQSLLLEFHFEKINLKDGTGVRIETDLGLVGRLYFHGMFLRDSVK